MAAYVKFKRGTVEEDLQKVLDMGGKPVEIYLTPDGTIIFLENKSEKDLIDRGMEKCRESLVKNDLILKLWGSVFKK